MQALRNAAFAAALIAAAGVAPAGTAHAQSDRLFRALDAVRGMRLGVSVSDVEADAKDTKQAKSGVTVDTVEPGGPADKAGIKAGDTITEFDGERVRSVRQFSRLVQETPGGRTVPVSVARGGQHLTVSVTPERSSWNDDFSMRVLETPLARPATPMPPEPPRAPRPPSVSVLPFDTFRLATGRRLGVSVESLDDQLAQYFGVKEGVLVRSVETDSSAQKAGVKAGDVITSVNGRQVYEPSDVNRAIERMDNSDEFTLEIVRDRKPQTLKGKLEPRQSRRSSVMF